MTTLNPIKFRLLRGPEFKGLHSGGKRYHETDLSAYWALAEADQAVGVSVGRKVGGAVVRNRLKRRIRALARSQRERLPVGLRMIVILRPPTAKYRWADLQAAFGRIVENIALKP